MNLDTAWRFADFLLLNQAGIGTQNTYERTPLDFINREEWFMSLLWSCFNGILANIYLGGIATRRIKVRPIDRIPSDNWLPSPMSTALAGGTLIVAYSTLFITAWNLSFPTEIERILWRVASIITLIFGVVGTIVAAYCHCLLLPSWTAPTLPFVGQGERISTSHIKLSSSGIRANKLTAKLRNNSPDGDPALEIPLRMLIPVTILCACYCVSRAYILIADAICLRSLPSSAFKTVEWSQYFPHL